MKLDRLEAHDRLIHLKKDQSANVFKGAEDCLKRNPLCLSIQDKCPYVYIFAHARTADNGIDKVLYWNPRLSIPEAQENSYLFRAISKTDLIEVCWMIPPKEMWKQYKKGNVTESNICRWSIDQFLKNKQELEKPHPNDYSEDITRMIMQSIVNEKREQLRIEKLYAVN